MRTRHRRVRRDRPHRAAAPGDAGRAAPRGVREARPHARRRPGRHRRAWQTQRRRSSETLAAARSRRGWMPDRADRQQAGALGFTRSPSEDDPRRDPRLLAAIARVAPGTELRQAIDDIIRSHEGALIVIGDPEALSFLYSGGMRLDLAFTAQHLYELAKMDGAIIVDDNLSKLAYANVQLMPDPTIPSNETGTRHRTAERVAKQTGRARRLDLAAAGDGDDLPGPAALPARSGRRRPREDEPGARDARHVPHAARAGADAADGARVPERRRARRRPRRPPARGDDDAHGGGDRARLRRARRGGPADQHAA